VNISYLDNEPETMIDTDCHIRWCIRRDLYEIIKIETEAFDFPWCEDDFIRVLRQRNAICMVAEVCELVAGFMLYEMHQKHLHVLNFAVRHDLRRRGIGTLLANKLKSKLSPSRRRKIELEVADYNLPAQQFWRANGFKAVGVVPEFFEQDGVDAYRFRYVTEEKECMGKK